MKARFIIEEYDKIKTDVAKGTFYFMSDTGMTTYEHSAISGGWGKGDLEPGNYMIDGLSGDDKIKKLDNPEPYTQYDFGWFASITAQFKTIRSNLGCHPDGNIEGSAGCIVFDFKNLNSNCECFNYFFEGIKQKGKIPLEVIVIQKGRRI